MFMTFTEDVMTNTPATHEHSSITNVSLFAFGDAIGTRIEWSLIFFFVVAASAILGGN